MNAHLFLPDARRDADDRRRWRRAAALIAFALLALLALPAAAAGARTWIVGATVISPERSDDGLRQDVLLEGERIAAIVPARPAGADPGAAVVDATGLYLVPGLIDAHVHLADVPGLTPLMQYRHPFLTRAYRAQLPRSYLRYGYTTVVDLLATDRGVLKDFAAAPAHPDLYHCAALPVRNGYPTHHAPAFLRDRVFPDYVVEAQAGAGAEAHRPQAVIERLRQQGAICAKTFFERGFGAERNLPVPSQALFAELVRTARAARLPVLLHASSIEAQRFGVDGGADVFVHGLWNWNAHNEAPALPPPARELLDAVVARGIGYMPTLQVIGGLRALYEPGFLDQPALRRVLPAALLAWYRSPAGAWFKEELANGAGDSQMRTRFDATLRRGSEATRYLAGKNAFFLFGSDTPSGPTAGNPPGLNGYLEMQRLVAAGVSLRQLFAAATLNNARAFGLADRVGSIAVGKRANLLLLARSPLQTVQAYDTIRTLWIGGRRLEPASLEAGK